jgi:hypothetical protein
MNAVMPDPEDVPRAARAWSARYGFLTDVVGVTEAHDEGAVVLSVDDGMVRDVDGDAPLAAVVRIDRDVVALASEVENLHVRLFDVFEYALDALARAAHRNRDQDR